MISLPRLKIPGPRVPLPLILLGAGLIALMAVLAACGDDGGDEFPKDLVGAFGVDAAVCEEGGEGEQGGPVTEGSYFRMAVQGQDPNNPDDPMESFFLNADSPCDFSYTPFTPGSDGALTTGSHQPLVSALDTQPDGTDASDNFDETGGCLADRIIQPVAFFGINFSINTGDPDNNDAQTGDPVPAPSITVDADGNLSGDITAWGACWNKNHFNQGSPKPDGCIASGAGVQDPNCGFTSGPTGTLDADTNEYTLEWSSLIVGGPFDGNTGFWHLEGTFEEGGGGE
ncbi:MAG: hypothetical protein ACE5KW_00980 [Dehalococcoidia bacterium]